MVARSADEISHDSHPRSGVAGGWEGRFAGAGRGVEHCHAEYASIRATSLTSAQQLFWVPELHPPQWLHREATSVEVAVAVEIWWPVANSVRGMQQEVRTNVRVRS